jgi:hypothetical protein
VYLAIAITFVFLVWTGTVKGETIYEKYPLYNSYENVVECITIDEEVMCTHTQTWEMQGNTRYYLPDKDMREYKDYLLDSKSLEKVRKN